MPCGDETATYESDECEISDQYFICYIETYIDNSQ
jgi:hypothetical protein